MLVVSIVNLKRDRLEDCQEVVLTVLSFMPQPNLYLLTLLLNNLLT